MFEGPDFDTVDIYVLWKSRVEWLQNQPAVSYMVRVQAPENLETMGPYMSPQPPLGLQTQFYLYLFFTSFKIWAGKLRLTPFAEFCSADFSYSHGFSIQPIPEMDEFIVYTNKVF